MKGMLDLQSKDIIYSYLNIKTTRDLSEIGIKYFKDKYKKVFDQRYLTSICNNYSNLSAILKDGQIVNSGTYNEIVSNKI